MTVSDGKQAAHFTTFHSSLIILPPHSNGVPRSIILKQILTETQPDSAQRQTIFVSPLPLSLLTIRFNVSERFELSDQAQELLYSPPRENSQMPIPRPDSSIVNSKSNVPPSTNCPQHFVSSGDTDVNLLSGEDEFKANLLEYSRSVIKSAMDHTPKETQALEDTMIVYKEIVVAQYKQAKNTITTLEMDLLAAREAIRQSQGSNEALKADQARLNADLKLEMQITDEVKRMYQAQMAKENRDFESWKKERARRQDLEVEIETLKQDKKRKREHVAEIWEKVEKVKIHK